MEVLKMNVEELVLAKKNARVHPQKQIDELVKSLLAYGQIRPAIVDENNVVLVGNGMVMAIKQMQIKTVDVVVKKDLSEKQKKKLMLSDNRLSSLGYDDADVLKEILEELDGDFEIPGFDIDLINEMVEETSDEIARLLSESSGLNGSMVSFNEANVITIDEVQEDDYVEVIPEIPISKTGDIWLLGPHRLICGDSTKLEVIQKVMDGEKANLVVTDPPYNVNYEGSAGKIKNDNMENGAFYLFLLDTFKNIEEVMERDASIYVFHADTEGLNFRKAFDDAGFYLSGTCVWKKESLVLGRSPYQWQHEPVLYGWKKKGKHNWYTGRKETTIWEFAKPKKNGEHPTMKPIPLIAYPIINSSKTDDIVLDTFGGSGSTLIACDQTNRICRTIELDEKFCDVIVNRYINAKSNSSEVFLIRDGKQIQHSEVEVINE